MYVVFLAAVSLFMLTWSAMDYQFSTGQGLTAEVQAMEDANREVAAYQSFLITAQAVMPHMPFTGSAVQTRTWADLRGHVQAPSFVKHVQMPANWRVRGNDSGWVVCAPMSEHASRMLSGYVPEAMGGSRISNIRSSGNTFVIMGEKDAARHAVYAAWCSG